jgi:hypothetical protein
VGSGFLDIGIVELEGPPKYQKMSIILLGFF